MALLMDCSWRVQENLGVQEVNPRLAVHEANTLLDDFFTPKPPSDSLFLPPSSSVTDPMEAH